MSLPDVTIRPMTMADIPRVVEVQIQFLDGSIITALGPRFLTRFHAAALQHDSTLGLVATGAGGDVLGFAVGSTDVHRFNGFVKPRVLLELARSLISPRGMRLVSSFLRSLLEPEPQPHIPAELLLLVVDGRHRRFGIGTRLLSRLEQELRAQGVAVYRVAVRSQLSVARDFYTAIGFQPEQELTVLGQPMTYLVRGLDRR